MTTVSSSASGHTGPSRSGIDEADQALLIDVARRYFLSDESKVDIAAALGISRFKVARLITLARDTGIVKISIAAPSAVDRSLSGELADHLGLRRCVAIQTGGGEDNARRQVAAAAAKTLPDIVRGGDLLGLSWSRTLEAMVEALTHLPPCSVVQLAGSVSSKGAGASNLVYRAARLSGGLAHAVHAPLVVDDAGVATALRRQSGISDTLQLADGLDVSVVAVGAWRTDCSTVWDAVSREVRDEALDAGAVAEVSGRLLDAAGAAVVSPLDDLVVGASLDQLRRPKEKLAVVSGPHRASSTRAAVRAELVTTLVTTTDVARAILQLGEDPAHETL
jgi:DNA-binding transcriptional regulator LsrR (DeoR family)